MAISGTWILERKFKDVAFRSDNPKVTANVMIRIDKPEISAGRNVYCDIVCNSLKVSRKHATFIVRPDDALYVMDNWSSNGTFVNGKLIPTGTPFLLQVDDEVGLGVYSEMNITTSFINPVIDFKNIYIVKQEVDTKEGIEIVHNGTDDMEIVELSTTQHLQAMLTDDDDINNHNNANNKKAELTYDNNYDDGRYSTQELCNILAFDDKYEGNLNGGANKNAMDCESKNYKSAEGVCYSEEDGVIVIDTDEVPCSQLLEIKEEPFDKIKQESIDLGDYDKYYDEELFDEIKLENIHSDDSDEYYHEEKLQDNSCNRNIDVNFIKNEFEITHDQQKKDNNDIINLVDEDDDCVTSTLNTPKTVNTINNKIVILHNQQNKNNNVQAVTLSESINDLIKQKKIYCNGKDDNLQKREEVEENLLPETLERISDKLRNPILRQIKITTPHTEVKKIKNDFKIPSQLAKKSAIKQDKSDGIAKNKSKTSSTIIEDINTKDGNSRGERKTHAKKCICEDKHIDTRKDKRSSLKETTKSKGLNYKKSTVKDIDTVKRQEAKKRKLKEIAADEKKKIKIVDLHSNAPVKVKVSNNTRGQFLMEVTNQNALTENKKLVVEDTSTKNKNVAIVDKNQVIFNEEREESKEDAKQNILIEEAVLVSDTSKNVSLEVTDQTLTKKKTVSLPIKRRIAHIENKSTANQNSSSNSSTSSLLESAPLTLPQFRIPKLPASNIINDVPIVSKDRNPNMQTFINKKLYIPTDGTVEETSIASDTRKHVLMEGTSQAATKTIKRRIAHTGIKSIVNQHSNCNSSTSSLLKTSLLTWPQAFIPKPSFPNVITDASNVPTEKNRNMQTFLNKKPNVLTDRQNSLVEETNPVSDARKNVSVQITNEVSNKKEAVSLPVKRHIAHIENKNIVNQHTDCNSSTSSLFKPPLLTLSRSRVLKLPLPNIINGASNVPPESNANIPTFIKKKPHVSINHFSEDLILSMLSWKTRWFEFFRDSNALPETFSNRLTRMPLFFETFQDYYKIFKVYLELELFHSIYKTLNCSNTNQQSFQAQIDNEIKKQTYVELQCSTYLNQEQSSHSNVLKRNFVVLIQFAIKQNGKTITIPLLGFVTDVTIKKLHNNMIIDENFSNQIQVKPFAQLLFTVMVENYKGYAVKSMKIFIRSMTVITTFIRYMESVKQLKQSPLCQHILKPSIDLYATFQYQNNVIPLDTSLNLSQFEAVSEAIQMYLHKKPGVYLIQGPPGTGKTTVILKIIQQLLMREHQDSRQPCILVTAPSNVAVDEIAMGLIKLKSSSNFGHKGIKLVRVGVRPMINMVVQDYYIFDLVRKNIVSNLLRCDLPNDDKNYISSLYKTIKQAKVEYFSLNGKSKLQVAEQQFDYGIRKYFKENYNFIFKRKQQELLDKADVICSTLSSSLGSGLSSVFYRGLHNRKLTLIIDEASRSCEPETLIPLSLNIDKVILAGDPKQLPAVTLCQRSKDLGHGTSVFERLSQNFGTIGCSIKMLNVQYRMHPEIARFPNETFYNGKLINAISVETRRNKLQMLKPYMVFNLKTNMHCSQEYSNKMEATCVITLLEAIALNLNCSEKFSVGVITPYNDQKEMIRTRLSDKKLQEKFRITVNTVDSFQGLEKDIIILSFVREYGNTFVSDEQRINVAVTRAKYVLYIIGSEDLYESCKTLNAIYQDALIRNVHKVITHETQNRQLAKLICL